MKYIIILEKINDQYLAYCPLSTSLRAYGSDVGSALTNLQRNFYCYLHDPLAELDIVINDDDDQFGFAKLSHYKQAMREGRILFQSKDPNEEVIWN
ncbi:MAG: hypothetical protein JW871_00160 [Endomicrobiales bacterium]|nr:hypothetical protein [Endomicrobiales bacterium]